MPEQRRLGSLPFHPVNQWAWGFLRQAGLRELEPRSLAVLALADLNDPEGLDSEESLRRLADREGFLLPPLNLNPLEVFAEVPALPLWFQPESPEESQQPLAPRFLDELQQYLNRADPKSWQEARESAQLALLSLAAQHSTSESVR